MAPQLFQKMLQKSNLRTTHENESFMNHVSDLLQGFPTLYSYGLLGNLVTGVQAAGARLMHIKLKQVKAEQLAGNTGGFFNIIGQLVITAWTGFLAFRRLIPIGAINSTYSLSYNILNSIAAFGPTLTEMRALQPVFDKYQFAQADDGRHKQQLQSSETAITLDHLSYRYAGAQQDALAPISLTIQPHAKIAIQGPSGAGKSTLLGVIAGKLPDYQGSIKLQNIELNQLAPSSLISRVLYVDQAPHIFNGTVRENLELGKTYSDEQLSDALAKADLLADVNRMPQALDTLVGESGKMFSGGQRQRLALTRAFLRMDKRSIMLFDESTNSLSKESAIQIENTFLSIAQLTVIFVSHQIHAENSSLFSKIITL
ncbi:MAG: ATP-binding cassette domain-containing protein [Oenococcus sp.]|uniref:ATP-binding cassette domain-containing protein n=1 Tax=Oenococcus sp. TaxID=1979414 RepID=UPI0039E7457A